MPPLFCAIVLLVVPINYTDKTRMQCAWGDIRLMCCILVLSSRSPWKLRTAIYRPTAASHFHHQPWPEAVEADKRQYQLPHSHFNPLHLRPLPSAPYPTIRNHPITSTCAAHPGTALSPHVSVIAAIAVIAAKRTLEYGKGCCKSTATARYPIVMTHKNKING